MLSVNVANPIQYTCEPHAIRVATASNYHEHPNPHHELHTPLDMLRTRTYSPSLSTHTLALHTHPFYCLDQKSKFNRPNGSQQGTQSPKRLNIRPKAGERRVNEKRVPDLAGDP